MYAVNHSGHISENFFNAAGFFITQEIYKNIDWYYA